MANEDAVVQKSLEVLRVARRVIQAYHKDREDAGFQEEPSLTDLLMVAQVMTQASAMDRLEGFGRQIEDPSPLAAPPNLPAIDLAVEWLHDQQGWRVIPNPECGDPVFCATPQELEQVLNSFRSYIVTLRLSSGGS